MNRYILLNALKNNRYFLAACVLYALIQVTLVIYYGATTQEILFVLSPIIASLIPLLCILGLGNVALSIPFLLKKGPFLTRLEDFLQHIVMSTMTYFRTPRGAEAFILMLCTIPFFFSFIVGKSLIPFIHPFSWDEIFAQIDFSLHLDHYPHTLLPGLKDSHLVTTIAERAYAFWFLILSCANGFAVFFDNDAKRRKIYFWASLTMWAVGGNILATAFSSVGPIFYGDFVTGPNPYTDIYANMKAAESGGSKLWPSTVSLLLELNQHRIPCDLNGISAFPSMHVGASMLICLYAWSVSRWLGIVMAFYTAMILAASIVLGFHYAIDGYFIILFVSAVWWGLHRIVKP